MRLSSTPCDDIMNGSSIAIYVHLCKQQKRLYAVAEGRGRKIGLESNRFPVWRHLPITARVHTHTPKYNIDEAA
jgi:hypothetical protein